MATMQIISECPTTAVQQNESKAMFMRKKPEALINGSFSQEKAMPDTPSTCCAGTPLSGTPMTSLSRQNSLSSSTVSASGDKIIDEQSADASGVADACDAYEPSKATAFSWPEDDDDDEEGLPGMPCWNYFRSPEELYELEERLAAAAQQ